MDAQRKPTFAASLLVMLLASSILLCGVLVLGLDPHLPLLMAIIPISLYGVYLRISWADLMESAYKSITDCMEAAILILTIGMVVSAWIASGTVPFVIYWGVKLFAPQTVLPLTLVFCALMTMLTGSSWTTVGTLGVAFLGIGTAVGINPAMIVGAICCGAFFGNAQSPMADVPIFSEAVTGVGQYRGTKAGIVTNVPALAISLVIFVILGLQYGTAGADAANASVGAFLAELEGAFNLSPATLIPVAIMLVLMVVKFPAIPLRLVAALSGVACAVAFQGKGIAETFGYMMNGYVSSTGFADIDTILTRGGMMGMASTIIIMIFSMWMAGIIQRTGIVEVILKKVSHAIERIGVLVAASTLSTLIFNFVAADPFLAITLPVKAFGATYDKLGYSRTILCRSVAHAAYFAPMVPWGSGGIFVASTLGVATVSYIPFFFTALIAPILAIAFGMLGMFLPRAKTREEPDTQTARIANDQSSVISATEQAGAKPVAASQTLV